MTYLALVSDPSDRPLTSVTSNVTMLKASFTERSRWSDPDIGCRSGRSLSLNGRIDLLERARHSGSGLRSGRLIDGSGGALESLERLGQLVGQVAEETVEGSLQSRLDGWHGRDILSSDGGVGSCGCLSLSSYRSCGGCVLGSSWLGEYTAMVDGSKAPKAATPKSGCLVRRVGREGETAHWRLLGKHTVVQAVRSGRCGSLSGGRCSRFGLSWDHDGILS
jgi:hypothetical protein